MAPRLEKTIGRVLLIINHLFLFCIVLKRLIAHVGFGFFPYLVQEE